MRSIGLSSPFRGISSASQPPMQTVDVSEPVRDTSDTLRAQMEDRPIRVRQIREVAVRRVLGNLSQLQPLFLNLCLNAIQAKARLGR